jgi:hypothetical protein
LSPGLPDLFGQPLRADPEIALQPLRLDLPFKTGPLHKIQFVIEFVGQRSVPASNAAQLLAPDWYEALGRPKLHCMRPADLQWQPLTPAPDGSYDSLAITWDLLSPLGNISSASAAHLLELAETFAPYIQRRAMAMPVPREVDVVVRALKEAKNMLDIGFELTVMSSRACFEERELWIECAKLGLEFSPTGSFDWKVPGHPHPLLSVTPIGQTDAFALSNVQRNMTHVGVTIGFSLPLNIAPAQAIEGCFYVAERIARDLGACILDDANREVTEAIKNQLRQDLKQGLSLFARAGMTTGSAETIGLFA